MSITPDAPAVSVVMAVFRPDARYLQQAVQSILTQTLRDLELIIVEDPSSIAAADVLRDISDRRLHIHRNDTPAGLGQSLNVGLRLARAPIVARMDGDDIALPHRLETQLRFLNEHPEVTLVGSRITIIDEEGKAIGARRLPLSNDDIHASLRRYNCIAHPSIMFHRDAILAAGGYDANIRAEDYDLFCRLARRGDRLQNLEEQLTQYRFHRGALKFDAVHDQIRITIRVKRRHFQGLFSPRDKARILGERLLLAVPPRLIVWLFVKLQY